MWKKFWSNEGKMPDLVKIFLRMVLDSSEEIGFIDILVHVFESQQNYHPLKIDPDPNMLYFII